MESPAFTVLGAAGQSKHPTGRVNELWQTDFTYFKIPGWGRHYVSAVLNDFFRYILACPPWWARPGEAHRFAGRPGFSGHAATGFGQDWSGPRVGGIPATPASENGSCSVSRELQLLLERKHLDHTRKARHHPMTPGKIERYHLSMKNIVYLRAIFFREILKPRLPASWTTAMAAAIASRWTMAHRPASVSAERQWYFLRDMRSSNEF